MRQAIEATRALLPLVEPTLGPDAKQVRDALSQLQLAYARSGAKPPPRRPPRAGEPPAAAEARRAGLGRVQRAALGAGPVAARQPAGALPSARRG